MFKDKAYIIAIIILVSIAIARYYFAINNSSKKALGYFVGKEVKIKGIIINEPEKKEFSQIFVLNLSCIEDKCDIYDDINIRITTDLYKRYSYGDLLAVSGKLISPFNFESNGGRTFDYVDYLAKDNIFYEIKKSSIKILDFNKASHLVSFLFLLKQHFLSNLKMVMGEPHAALAGGLVVGEKSALGKDLLDDFRKAGLIHIVVLSGYNITIIASSIRRSLSFLPRKAGIIFGMIGIILFGILVGGGATVIRSCIMASIALVADLVRRDYNVTRALVLAGLIMIIQNPLILFYDPSFQLSFLATIGLITLSFPIEKHLGFITEKFGIRALIASTFATQLFVSPYIFYIMGQLSIVGVIVNILVLPLIPITMLFVFLAGILGFLSHLLSQILGWISHLLLSYELYIVEYFSHLPFASIEVPKFSFSIVLGIYTFYLAAFLKLPSMISQFIFAKKSST